MEIPAISVIIPMYNTEKYVGECLDSLLAQTFRTFEVIVVDDCSTDNSAAIVQSYIPRFGGRLTFTSLEKNSGNAGYSARNKGFSFSRGEYIFFVDADDMLTKSALEELYTAAKSFDADVVYTSTSYFFTADKETELGTDYLAQNFRRKGIKYKPLLTVNDPHKILNELLIINGLHRTSWTKFVKRNFLTENEITFPEIITAGDYVWTVEIFACAKRLLQIPNTVYFWRDDSVKSMTRKKRPVDKQVCTWSKSFFQFAEAMAKLSDKRNILKENPLYAYFALLHHFNYCFSKNLEARLEINPKDIYDILRQEFEGDTRLEFVIPFLFSVVDGQQKNSLQVQQHMAHLENELKQLKE